MLEGDTSPPVVCFGDGPRGRERTGGVMKRRQIATRTAGPGLMSGARAAITSGGSERQPKTSKLKPKRR